MRQRMLSVSALVALSACQTGASPPFLPKPPPPAIFHSVSSRITPNAGLRQAVSGPDGRIWFTEFNADNVAAATTGAAVTEYPMPSGSQPDAITAGRDGNVWAGGHGGEILRINTSGLFTPYPIAGAHIGGMAVGPDGNVWFTDYGNDAVGKITPSGSITEYPAPGGAMPKEIAEGSDGNLWVTDENGSILRVSIFGAVTKFSKGITAGGHPQAIVAAPDSNLYFTEPFFSAGTKDRIAKVTLAGAITELGSLAPNSFPNQIALGVDGNLYFTEFNTGNIGRVVISSPPFPVSITETALGIISGSGIVNGPDNNLWVGGLQTIYQLTY